MIRTYVPSSICLGNHPRLVPIPRTKQGIAQTKPHLENSGKRVRRYEDDLLMGCQHNKFKLFGNTLIFFMYYLLWLCFRFTHINSIFPLTSL